MNLSIRSIIQLHHTAVAVVGLLLSTVWTRDLDQLLHGCCSSATASSVTLSADVGS